MNGGAAPPLENPGLIGIAGVDAGQIGRAVAGLWKDASGPGDAGSVQRACVLNLVVVLDEAGQLEETFATLGALVMTHPARTVVIVPDPPGAELPPRAEVSIQCSFTPGAARHVCAERIVLRAPAGRTGLLHQAVLALLVPEMRRFLWWRAGSLGDRMLYDHLAPEMDHALVDSRDWPQDATSLELFCAEAARPGFATLRDLNWGRLTPWRELTAQMFDSPPARAALARVNHIRMTSAETAAGGVPLSALLAVAWMLECLGCTGCEAGNAPLSATAWLGGGRRMEVLFSLVPRPGHEGRFVSVEIGGPGDGSRRDRFCLTRSPDMRRTTLETDMPGEAAVARCTPLHRMEQHALLSRELGYWGRDLGYEKALANARTLTKVLAR